LKSLQKILPAKEPNGAMCVLIVRSMQAKYPDRLLRKRIHRDGPFEDVVCWTILKEEWVANQQH
jgi:hypothetical protein